MARDSIKLFRNSRFSLSALPFLPGAPLKLPFPISCWNTPIFAAVEPKLPGR